MDTKNVNAMRALALNAIKKAGQGHTGMAMSAAPINYTIYTKFMNINSKDNKWINRDRFILSAGHGSMSLYSALHFSGLLSIDDIKKHKTEGSHTPGHPEYENDNHIDASTGPLGQGLAEGVGMAIAEEFLANKFKNLKGLIDHYTYVVLGDGCLQEGISYESMSLAGKLKLSKLTVIHDSNSYQIDANVNASFIEDLEKRVTSMGWSYKKCSNNPTEIEKSILEAKKINKPSFIEVITIIGEGTSAQGTRFAHGLKVDDKEEFNFSKYFDFKMDEFKFDQDIYDYFYEHVIQRGSRKYSEWKALHLEYSQKFPEEIKEFDNAVSGNFPDINNLISFKNISSGNRATRDYVKEYLLQINKNSKSLWFLLGSADLASATNVMIDLNKSFADDRSNSDLLYGIREFAMGSIQNGITLHGGMKTICSTFLVFSDYMKSAIRLGALNNLATSYIFTHDSYQVGGDGPTHQPYDQLPMLRAIANTDVHRPCDEIESQYVMEKLFNSKYGTNIGIFTRQPLKSGHPTSIEGSRKGGYILCGNKNSDLTLVGAGSEIDLLFEVKLELEAKNINVKIVSVPSFKIFLENNETYITDVLASKNGIFSIEPSSDYIWYKLSKYGKNYAHFGAFTFGESMDGDLLYKKKGFNVENILNILKKNSLV